MANTFTPISPSLYVGDLLPEVSEQTLFEVFNQVGLVSNIRVCRDTNTRRSLNYAYVNYYNAGDAERALDTLNNTPIRGKPCRIMWSQRDPSLRKSGVGNVFIKNLDKGIDHKALYDTFSAFGNILSCKVVTDDNNTSKGFGFVHYESQESADKAIEKVNGMMINGQKVFVGPFKSSKERGHPTEIKFTNVFFKNLNEDVDSEKLKDQLIHYGPITNITIMVDDKGKSKGFGFANFESPEAAKNCVENENGRVVNGKPIYAGRAQKKIEREAELKHTFETKYQGVNLYIKNIDDSIDNDKLRECFTPFGTITSAIVMKDDKSSSSKGFGFVCYTSPDEATRAVTEMNGRMIGTKPLYVALAQRKDIRRAQLEMQHSQKFKSGGIRQQPMAPAYSSGPVFFTPAPGPMNPQVVYQQMMPRAPRTWNGAPVGVPQGQYPINYGVRGQPRQPNGPRANGPRPNGQRPDSAQPIPAQPIETAAPVAQPAATQTEAPLTLASLNGLPRDQQNVALGEHLYPLIQSSQPELAGKITGMLLDSLAVEELFTLTQRTDLLEEKINEAIEVLKTSA